MTKKIGGENILSLRDQVKAIVEEELEKKQNNLRNDSKNNSRNNRRESQNSDNNIEEEHHNDLCEFSKKLKSLDEKLNNSTKLSNIKILDIEFQTLSKNLFKKIQSIKRSQENFKKDLEKSIIRVKTTERRKELLEMERRKLLIRREEIDEKIRRMQAKRMRKYYKRRRGGKSKKKSNKRKTKKRSNSQKHKSKRRK